MNVREVWHKKHKVKYCTEKSKMIMSERYETEGSDGFSRIKHYQQTKGRGGGSSNRKKKIVISKYLRQVSYKNCYKR